MPNFLRIDAAPVVADLDHHLVALVIRVQPDCSLRRLSRLCAAPRRLDAMADGVAHQVRERLGNGIQNAFVEIGFLPADDQFDFASALPRDVPHHAREAAEQLIDRHHANLHHRALQVVQHPRLETPWHRRTCPAALFRIALRKFDQRLLQHRFADDQFTHQIQYVVDPSRIHAQKILLRRHELLRRGARPGMPLLARDSC